MRTDRPVHLTLLGTPSIERDGAPLPGKATHRDSLAVLAVLALSPERRANIEMLIATVWPGRDREGARNSFRLATDALREVLGDGALVSEGDALLLSSDIVEIDVAEFEAAVERSDHAHAVALYRGPLLDDFVVNDATALDQLLGRERQRLATLYGTALEALADAAERQRDFRESVEHWRKRAVLDPDDARIALRLMYALEATGDRAGALRHGETLQEKRGVGADPEIEAVAHRLRRELAVAPPPPREAVMVLEPKLLNHRDAKPPVSSPAVSRAPTPRAVVPTPVTRSARHVGKWAAVGALLAAGMFAAVWAALRGTSDPEPSIVVLPFVNLTAGEDNDHFSAGLTEEIITRLGTVPGLKVISRTSAMHYQGSKAPLQKIAGELNVAHVLEGSVRHSGGRVRISAQLIDTRTDGHLWAQSYEQELQHSFRVQEQIAQEVVRALEVELGERVRTMLARQGTRDPEAYRLYRRGRYLWGTRTKEAHDKALDYYQQAIARDSGYADAYAAIADAYLTAYQLNLASIPPGESYSRLKWAAERALALDDRSADAHTAFAIALWWQKNWPGAERELRRALELNPGQATARSWYSLLLGAQGRSREALRESRRAAELDPLAVVVSNNYGLQCYLVRDYDCAMEQYRRAIDIGNYPGAHRGLGMAHAQKGMHDDAIRSVRKAIALAPERPDFLADLAYVQALGGDTAAARETLDRARAEPWEGFNIARAYVALHEPDSAFAWFERTNWHWAHRAQRNDPALDPVRRDARFAHLVSRIDREMGVR